jgi:hypothetical protein
MRTPPTTSLAYPVVTSEVETLRRVCEGQSLARYGDGEFNLCHARPAKMQRHDARLSARLREILKDSGDCLVGIPNIRSDTPKAAFWRKYKTRADLLTDRPYVSSFITRPDSAPWIHTPDYWSALESLWVGQDVTIVCGGRHGLTKADLVGATHVREVMSLNRDAWTVYGALLRQIGTPSRVLLCLGPTATVMAVDLCAKGVHAIDLGHVGMFLRKARAGRPMTVTTEDKAT